MARRFTRMGTFAMAATLMAGLAGAAHASDYCIDVFDGGTYTVVGKGFRVPGKNRCKPFMGFTTQGFDVTGSACTAADGSHMQVVLTESARGSGSSSIYHMTVDFLSPAQGNIAREAVSDGYLYVLIPMGAQPCMSPQPVF